MYNDYDRSHSWDSMDREMPHYSSRKTEERHYDEDYYDSVEAIEERQMRRWNNAYRNEPRW